MQRLQLRRDGDTTATVRLSSDSRPQRHKPDGHTRLTHSGDIQPECVSCHCPLTVKHIISEGGSFDAIRGKYFSCSSLKYLLENVDSHNLIHFIKELPFTIVSDSIILFLYYLNSLNLIAIVLKFYSLLTCFLAVNICF